MADIRRVRLWSEIANISRPGLASGRAERPTVSGAARYVAPVGSATGRDLAKEDQGEEFRCLEAEEEKALAGPRPVTLTERL